MAVSTVNTPMPVGNTYRALGADLFNNKNIAQEDFMRDIQKAQYSHNLDLESMELQNEFNSVEAQKQRDFEERMSSTAYTRAIEDMKKAGLNPILAYSNGGASTPQGSSASSGSGSNSSVGSSRGSTADTASLVKGALTIALMAVGLYGDSVKKATHFGFGKKIK